MSKNKKDQKKVASKTQSEVTQKIRKGKAELSDKELSKVSGGTKQSQDFH